MSMTEWILMILLILLGWAIVALAIEWIHRAIDYYKWRQWYRSLPLDRDP